MSAATGSANAGWASGLLLAVAGVWLLLQTLVGGLVGRIIGLGNSPSSSTNENVGPSAGQISGGQTANAGGYTQIPNLAPGQTSTGPSGQKYVGA